MGIAEALRILNDFCAEEVGEPSDTITTTCKCGHGLRYHKRPRRSRHPKEPCGVTGCRCCDFRPMTVAEKANRIVDQT